MTDAAARIAARLAELWQTSRPAILERMTVLRTSSEALARNPQDEEARSSGGEVAHKLSGILGIFGLPRGTELASSIEDLLRSSDPLTPDRLATLAAATEELARVIAARDEA